MDIQQVLYGYNLRSSITFRCEFECLAETKVGLAAGRYSGTSRPDLYRTPHALHRVFGPIGPVLHCGVFSDAQWRHLRPGASAGSLLLAGAALGERTKRREDQSQGAARERLLRALPGTEASAGKNSGGGGGGE
ncbi:peptide chain release factor 1 [Striga asiatica]|uniref:Peptide chain release factor 1 n=1 Tax=Striga asiatica TaxID=4170 RepID=A0A5A7R4R5_STRAF|nr:peptide chain release factor 1 [Striga asiatica]